MRGRGDRAFAAFLLAVALLAVVPTVALGPGARRVPLLVVGPLAILLTLQVFLSGKGESGASGQAESSNPTARAIRKALLWAATFPALIQVAGLVLGSALFVVGFLRVQGRESALFSLVAGVAIGVLVWLAYSTGSTPLPPAGLLGEWMKP